MKTPWILLLVLLLGISTQATTYSFTPNPIEMADLDRFGTYSWGIELIQDEGIIGATAKIGSVRDWFVGDDSRSLLDYDFDADQLTALERYASNSRLGLGFDSDIPKYVGGPSMTVIAAVPEPTTMILFGLGLAGVGIRRRLRK